MSDIKVGDSWHETQRKLKECVNKEQVLSLIKEEIMGQNRARWINRMRGRYMVLRIAELDNELDDKLAGTYVAKEHSTAYAATEQ